MKDFEDKNLIEIEQIIKAQFEAIELEAAEETLAGIKPYLKKKRRRNLFKSHAFMTKFVAITASIILLFGIGLTVWFTLLQGDGPDIPPEYRYEDLDIELKPCKKSDILNYTGLYIPDLDIITMEEVYTKAIHKESLETVYFLAEGMNVDTANGIARKIKLTIIIQKKYSVEKEEDYNSDNKITINIEKITNPIKISYLEDDYLEPFLSYKVGFKIGDVRYYMVYQTTSSDINDINTFMELFLK